MTKPSKRDIDPCRRCVVKQFDTSDECPLPACLDDLRETRANNGIDVQVAIMWQQGKTIEDIMEATEDIRGHVRKKLKRWLEVRDRIAEAV